MNAQFVRRFACGVTGPGDLATSALEIAKLEYADLDCSRYLDHLEQMGATAAARLGRMSDVGTIVGRLEALNRYLFDEQGFAGNRENYDDPRNSFLNEVLDRRTGIPITLALVYIEVAQRAGVKVAGVNFPGHFLLRVETGTSGPLIIDPFNDGALLSEADCRQLLRQHAGDEIAFERDLLAPTTKQHIVYRMLVNLKRIYVRMRSFPQARDVTDLLLAIDPSALTELRDRGLLSYHLNHHAAALRDLESYLRLSSHGELDKDSRNEHQQIWEHVKALRRRVAGFN